MAKGTRGRRRISSRQCRPSPYPLPSETHLDEIHQRTSCKMFHKDWEDATCAVCMEYPHNAVLLLCSSHEKGCRPYMCGTSFRHSNCLEQYRKAYTKVTSLCHDQHLHNLADSPATGSFSSWPVDKYEVSELACPLCRGQVKGWTVVESARDYLNGKKRSCMQDGCSFVGNYRELRKHVRAEHPSAKPREVDPLLEQKWRRLEGEREREDVISTITSSMPRALVIGDYVIEGSPYSFASGDESFFDDDGLEQNNGFEVGVNSNWANVFLLLQTIGPRGGLSSNRGIRGYDRDSNRTLDGGAVDFNYSAPSRSFHYSDQDSENDGENDDNNSMSLVNRLRRQGRVLLGRSRRRRRRRGASRGHN